MSERKEIRARYDACREGLEKRIKNNFDQKGYVTSFYVTSLIQEQQLPIGYTGNLIRNSFLSTGEKDPSSSIEKASCRSYDQKQRITIYYDKKLFDIATIRTQAKDDLQSEDSLQEKKILKEKRKPRETISLAPSRVLSAKEVDDIKRNNTFLQELEHPEKADNLIDLLSGKSGLIEVERIETLPKIDINEYQRRHKANEAVKDYMDKKLVTTGKVIIEENQSEILKKHPEYHNLISKSESYIQYYKGEIIQPVRYMGADKPKHVLYINGSKLEILFNYTNKKLPDLSFQRSSITIGENKVSVVSNAPMLFDNSHKVNSVPDLLGKFTGLPQDKLFILIKDIAQRRQIVAP